MDECIRLECWRHNIKYAANTKHPEPLYNAALSRATIQNTLQVREKPSSQKPNIAWHIHHTSRILLGMRHRALHWDGVSFFFRPHAALFSELLAGRS